MGARKKIAVKSNELIQKFKMTNNIWESRAIAYVCSIIYEYSKGIEGDIPTDHEFSFKISDFRNECGISKSGETNQAIKDAIDVLQRKSEWVYIDDGRGRTYETRLAWIMKARIENDSVWFYADPDMTPMICHLHENFTQYEIENVLKMHSAYSIRLYELLKSYTFKNNTHIFESKELLTLMGADDVARYSNNMGSFFDRCLKPCMDEINEIADMGVTGEKIKSGKSITGFKFEVEKKREDKRNIA